MQRVSSMAGPGQQAEQQVLGADLLLAGVGGLIPGLRDGRSRVLVESLEHPLFPFARRSLAATWRPARRGLRQRGQIPIVANSGRCVRAIIDDKWSSLPGRPAEWCCAVT
jgi:hypothetical protein